MQIQRTNIQNRGYINTPYLNTGSVSGSQYGKQSKGKSSFDESLDSMDSLLSKLFNKYSEKLKK